MRLFIAIVLAATVLAGWTSSALAAEPRTTVIDVAVVTEEATHIFSVGWERGTLSVTLIAPDGTRIPQNAPPPGVRVATSDRMVIFRVDRAKPGAWRAEFLEYDNGKVGVVVQKLFRPLVVGEVTAKQDADAILVDFTLSGEAGKTGDYSVYLTLDGRYLDGRLLSQGRAGMGERVTLRCAGNDVSSYDKWFVTVYAECASGGFTDFHSTSSAPFAFANAAAPGQVKGLTATLLDRGIRVAWQPPDGGLPTDYLAVLYGADGAVAHSVTVGADRLEAILPLAGGGVVNAGVSAVKGSVCGLPVKVTVDADAKFSRLVGFDLPDQPATTGGNVELKYDTGGAAVPISLEADGEKSSLTLSGGGVLKLPVHSGTNRVTVSAQGGDGVWLSQSKTWMIDLVPPSLRLFEDWDAVVTTAKKVLVAGNAGGAVAVTVNGQDTLLGANGDFDSEVSLARGLNVVAVAARDASGNSTLYEARIERRNPAGFPWTLLAGAWVAALAVAGLVICIIAGIRRKLRRLTTIILSVMLVAIAAAALFGGITYPGRLGSPSMGDSRMTQVEREALAALGAGDPRDAYAQAVGSVVAAPGRPLSWLTAARSAVLIGDLAAADHYYGRLTALSPDELADWGLTGSAGEIAAWPQVAGLKGAQQRKAAADFAGRIDQNVRDEVGASADVSGAAANHAALLELETQMDKGQGVGSGQFDAQLAALMGQPGAERARQLRMDNLVRLERWGPLFEWLRGDGSRGLLDLAQLTLKGAIPDAQLPNMLGGGAAGTAGDGTGGTPDQAVRGLADTLWELRGDADTDQARLNLTVAELYTSHHLSDPGRAMDLVTADFDEGMPSTSEQLATVRRLHGLRLLLTTFKPERRTDALTQLLGTGDGAFYGDTGPGEGTGTGTGATTEAGTGTETTQPQDTGAGTTTGTTQPSLPDPLSGQNIRHDLTPFFNICAPEMVRPGHIRFYLTLTEGSDGSPGADPQASEFAFRTNVGFQRLLAVDSMPKVRDVERYTMLLIDQRPTMSADALALAKAAALAYVRSMPAGEKVLVYRGGIPSQYVSGAYPPDKVQLFGNPEMETYLFTSDSAALEQFISADYQGDAFDNPDMNHMVSWALNQMTAISPQGVTGAWETYPLTSATPRFGQVIMFTNGHPGEGVTAGGPKSLDFVRGAAIAANAAVHIVPVKTVDGAADLRALAEAGRGSYIDPGNDDLMAFYDFVRTREVHMFLADCTIPEDPVDQFFELWAKHLPTGVMAGFKRNPGRGVDLVGTLQYSDAYLSDADFQDFTGGGTDNTGGGDPFGTGSTTGAGGGAGSTGGGTGGGAASTGATVIDWPGLANLRVDGLDRHAIARGQGGLMLVNLLGQGFEGLAPSSIQIAFPGLGTLQSAFVDVMSDSTIRFFLPVTMPAGMYSMNVTIGGHTFSFPDTLWVYDADGFTTRPFGAWTITAESVTETADGDWRLSGAAINDYLHFTGTVLVTGDWLDAGTNELTLTPDGDAYIAFDPGSTSYLAKEIFLKRGADLVLGTWEPITLERSGQGVSFHAWQLGSVLASTISLGVVDMPYDTGTLFPDKVQVPIVKVNLDLPLQNYLLMSEALIPCTATAEATFSADGDSADLALTAGVEADKGVALKFMNALKLSELKFEIDTAAELLAVDLGVKLVGDDAFKAHLALKGDMLDEITITLDTKIPVTKTPPSPLPVDITELGGGLENMSALASGNVADTLGVTLVGLAKLEAGSATSVLPFLSGLPWLKDDIPPLLATDNTELRLRPWPFSLEFATELKLFDEFPIGSAELSIGTYAFSQTLLGISDEDAIGLHALINYGPDIDLFIIRLKYGAGPSLDINQHGFFLAASGDALLGLNLGALEFTASVNGTLLVAVHDIPGSSWPQLSLVANVAPSAGIPGLWSAGDPKDMRLLINEYGFRLVGIPSPLDVALEWLGDQIDAASQATWEAITEGMATLGELGGMTWDVLGDGVDLAAGTLDDMAGALTDGLGVTYDTATELLADVGTVLSNPGATAGSAIQSGYSGITSTASGVKKWLGLG